jgi:tRNA threonylcarbamoyl adenosine modification protein (Sua5/YciO/YrdC/YwlC family)
VYTHCIVDNESTEWVEKMPGPYTLILRLKDPNSVPQAVHPGVDTIGVRIPDHWFSSIIAETGVPIITTSANVTGQQFMTNIDNLNDDIRSKCDFIIYEGEKRGRPSTVIELHKDEVELLHR